MKTIFIVITRGFIVRNILRSGVLKYLKETGYKIIVIFPTKESVPQYLRDEFEDDQVVIEGVKEEYPRGYSYFLNLTGPLVLSSTTKVYFEMGNKRMLDRSFIWKYIESSFYFLPSKISFLKNLVRYLDLKFFRNATYDYLFEKYKPDLLFSTSIISKFDITLIKEARRRKILTLSMPKGWDNVSKSLYRILPDKICVQNELMKSSLIKYQGVTESTVEVVGFPQFDWYRKPEILLSRYQFMNSLGFKESDKLIFFGSEGVWVPEDHQVAGFIAKAISEGMITPEAKMLVRPHFSDVNNKRLEYLSGANVLIDTHFRHSAFFIDNWDPDVAEAIHLANIVHHADVLVTTASTLNLDAAFYDTPLVNAVFGGLFDAAGNDITAGLFKMDHLQWITATKAVTYAYNPEELIQSIQFALDNPAYKREERKLLIEKLCFKDDGQASRRVVSVIKKMLAERV